MRHQKHGRILSRRVDHRKALLANLACSLILHGRIKTTEPKAKEVRPFIERMVTFARRGDLHARRIVLSRIRDAEAVKKLFDEIGPKFANRNGGYTRILKLGFRHGDNSPMSYIEFVTEDEGKKKPVKRKKAGSRVKAGAKAPETAQAPETAEATETAEAQETEEVQAEAAPSEKVIESSAGKKKKPADKKKKEKKTGEKAGE